MSLRYELYEFARSRDFYLPVPIRQKVFEAAFLIASNTNEENVVVPFQQMISKMTISMDCLEAFRDFLNSPETQMSCTRDIFNEILQDQQIQRAIDLYWIEMYQ
jgi:hypothetical protein